MLAHSKRVSGCEYVMLIWMWKLMQKVSRVQSLEHTATDVSSVPDGIGFTVCNDISYRTYTCVYVRECTRMCWAYWNSNRVCIWHEHKHATGTPLTHARMWTNQHLFAHNWFWDLGRAVLLVHVLYTKLCCRFVHCDRNTNKSALEATQRLICAHVLHTRLRWRYENAIICLYVEIVWWKIFRMICGFINSFLCARVVIPFKYVCNVQICAHTANTQTQHCVLTVECVCFFVCGEHGCWNRATTIAMSMH